MKSFLYNYANGITINNGEKIYIDAIQNFTFDCAKIGFPLMRSAPDDVYEFFAIDNGNPKDSYAKTRQYGQMGFNVTGNVPSDYFQYIDAIEKLIDAKRNR